ncbi:hypothetical protein [Streptomyces sp. SD31]|uniref:hypothetical protein n=1 Tax=Streptomyces sp. SD31 TaxID=3452208 RepID=UPI003F89F081
MITSIPWCPRTVTGAAGAAPHIWQAATGTGPPPPYCCGQAGAGWYGPGAG